MIAKVIFPLPIDTPFDYCIPKGIEKHISCWSRVRVPFGNRELVGYVGGFSKKSHIRSLKSIISLLDKQPLLDEVLYRLAKYVFKNYFCSLGEAINLLLPNLLRKGKKLEIAPSAECQPLRAKEKSEVFLLRSWGIRKWQFLQEKIKETINREEGIIILEPELHLCLQAKQMIEEEFKKEAVLLHSKNTDKEELELWLKVKTGKAKIVVGTSFAVFAPVRNLGLIIIDEEDSPVYKQEQSPFYNAKDIALFRARESGADLILASSVPSLDSYYLAKKAKFRLIKLLPEEKPNPSVQVVDITEERHRQKKRNIILSNILENNINQAVTNKKKVMLFLNRVGFATYAKCANCGFVIKCSRCSKNLVFIYGVDKLICQTCNFKLPVPKICPECSQSYIRYSGLGTEKLESECSRLFPFNKVLRYDRLDSKVDLDKAPFDILIATQIVLKDLPKLKNIDLVGIISLDLSLNRVDFRAAEKTFQVVSRLISIAKEKVIIQTGLPQHYVIKPLMRNDYSLFYKEELSQRKELLFPPFSSLALISLRGRQNEKVELAAESLFEHLQNINRKNKIEIFNPSAAHPLKLRDNFRYNILLKSRSKKALIHFINKHLKGFKKSGIIITVDMEPL